MQTLFIITGTNKGLGKALSEKILSDKIEASILSLGRSCDMELAKQTDRFRHTSVDLTDSSAISMSLQTHAELIKHATQVVFISNAGTISPITAIGQMNETELIQSVAVNATAPAIICNYLLKVLNGKKLKLVNISSGAATRAIDGWASYCAGKAFAKMFFDVLKEQVQNKPDMEVYQINPGVIDTDMQKEIRSANAQTFPEQNRFIELSEEGQLQTPDTVAIKILKVVNL